MTDYGKELILDLHNCDAERFTRFHISRFFRTMCDIINMKRGPLYFWDDLNAPEGEKATEPHLVGISAVQFIETSNITIHTLSMLNSMYLNLFSCKDFNENEVRKYAIAWSNGTVVNEQVVRRI